MSSDLHDCRVCSATFETEEELNDHMEAEHSEQGMV
ncbi:C2H2-type zinc finger protein [Halococcus saccharolyticus]|nr:C2H2-type zinc finger protein [Halococcus saccharolyticus]